MQPAKYQSNNGFISDTSDVPKKKEKKWKKS